MAFLLPKFTSIRRHTHDDNDLNTSDVSFHWVNLGPKPTALTANAGGLALKAITSVIISRPTVDVFRTKTGPFIALVVPFADVYQAWATMEFSAQNLSAPGFLQWVQIGVFENDVVFLGGNPGPSKHEFGLDMCKYPHASGPAAADEPSIGFDAASDETVKRKLEVTMYLMWKSARGGIWVPLRSINWRFNGILKSTGPTTAPIWSPVPPAPAPNPNFSNDNPVDELAYPEWDDCFNAGG